MNKIYESYERIGIEEDRSYYIPFAISDVVKTKYSIIDRESSSRFFLLSGNWEFATGINEYDLNEKTEEKIIVPAAVQVQGYDTNQYINYRYPFPFDPPYIRKDNPYFHYRKSFSYYKEKDYEYFLNFEAVDSFFVVYLNGELLGQSQIAHATSEFKVTDKLLNGENHIDVIVYKYSAGSYYECQDKFRMSGIIRDVFLLKRPLKYIRDFKLVSESDGKNGKIICENLSNVSFMMEVGQKKAMVKPGEKATLEISNIEMWDENHPTLYDVSLSTDDEIIYEKIGFRDIKIDGRVLKLNGEKLKFRGINRHESCVSTGSYVSLKETYDDIMMIKSLNANAIRTSHYPNRPEFYQLCDALGVYVIDEADMETHGAAGYKAGYDYELWHNFAENMVGETSVFEREKTLYERDKNRTSVLIWSLGNECCYGQVFFRGCQYIRQHDPRPIHYENIAIPGKTMELYYNTDMIDFSGRMYTEPHELEEKILKNPEETRPFLFTEYSHAMGNSNGGLLDYWNLIDKYDGFCGGFVWEFCDHVALTKDGQFGYGGDFGEVYHDSTFCVDGLVTADRKLKPGALELRAIYGGKRTHNEIKSIDVEKKSFGKYHFELQKDNLYLVGKDEKIVVTPTIVRAPIDNEMDERDSILNRKHIFLAKPYITEATENSLHGLMVTDTMAPYMEYTLTLSKDNALTMEYKLCDFIPCIGRVGLEFAMPKSYEKFSFVGFGKGESYIDKNMASEYGYFESTAEENFTNYLKPQECGSHYHTDFVEIQDAFQVRASQPFSFSYNPYSTETLRTTAHSYELKNDGYHYLYLDLAMRGIGTHSCGPKLDPRFEIPREGKTTFYFTL